MLYDEKNKRLEVAFKALYEDCLNEIHDNETGCFIGINGTQLNKPVRFLLVGRATNGWEGLKTNSEKTFIEKAVEDFCKPERWLCWIKEKNGKLYNQDENYCLSRSPFWTYSKDIYSEISGSNTSGRWMEQIAWTNLFSLAPIDGGNPSKKLMEKQLNACKKILKNEIDIIMPTHILMMVGLDWIKEFKELFTDIHVFGRNINRGRNKNDIFVEATAKYRGIPVVIACRPERRNKELYVKSVLQAFRA